MIWKIKVQGGQAKLTAAPLVAQLAEHARQNEKPDVTVLSQYWAQLLKQQLQSQFWWAGVLTETSLLKALEATWLLGYYYRVFVERYEVEFLNEEEDAPISTDQDGTTSTS
jgi:hypothetical protein